MTPDQRQLVLRRSQASSRVTALLATSIRTAIRHVHGHEVGVGVAEDLSRRMTAEEAVQRVQRERDVKRIDSQGERLVREIEVDLAAHLATLDELEVPDLPAGATMEIRKKREMAIRDAVKKSEEIRILHKQGGEFADRLTLELIRDRELQPEYRRFLREIRRMWFVKTNRVNSAIPNESLRAECIERLEQIFAEALDRAGAVLP